MLLGQSVALMLDGGEQFRVMERRLDLLCEEDCEFQVRVSVVAGFTRPKIQRTDHCPVEAERDDERRHVPLSLRPNALGPAKVIDAHRLPCSNRLTGETLIERERTLLVNEAGQCGVVQCVQVVVRPVICDKQHTRASERQHAAQLDNRRTEYLVEVVSGVNE